MVAGFVSSVPKLDMNISFSDANSWLDSLDSLNDSSSRSIALT
jgi:hypothetical protein